jgi:hypothetical protein
MTNADIRSSLLSLAANDTDYIAHGHTFDPGSWAYYYTLIPGAHATDGAQQPDTLYHGSDRVDVDTYIARRFGATTPAPNPLLPPVAATPPVNVLLPPPTAALTGTGMTSGTILGLSPLTLAVIGGGLFLLLRRK